MTTTDRVIIDDRALISWHYLPPASREQIHATLTSLAESAPAQWSRDLIEPWRPAEDLYALHTHVDADHLLVFFRPEGSSIRLLDMVLKETIDRYFTPKNGAKSA